MKRPEIPTAADIMRRHVQTVAPDDEIERAVRLLLKNGISGAPVVDAEGQVRGILSEYDCIQMLAASISSGWPAGHVRDHMTTEVETARPGEDLLVLAAKLAAGRHRRLLVVEDDGRLRGLVSRSDLLRALEAFEDKLGGARPRSTYELIDERHRKLD